MMRDGQKGSGSGSMMMMTDLTHSPLCRHPR